MSVALPVLVDCLPLAARLTVRACAERHEGANSWKRGAGSEAVATAHLRASSCRDCDVGEARLNQLGGTTMKTCPKCGKKGERMRASGNCWTCDPKAGTSASVSARPKPKLVAKSEPPLVAWLRLNGELRELDITHANESVELDQRQRQERADALAKIGAFERDNPGLAEDAKRQLEHLASKPALGSAQ